MYSDDGNWVWNDQTKEWIPAPPSSATPTSTEVVTHNPYTSQHTYQAQISNHWTEFDKEVQSSSSMFTYLNDKKIIAISICLIIIVAGFIFLSSDDEIDKIEWEFSVTGVNGLLQSDDDSSTFATITMLEGSTSDFKNFAEGKIPNIRVMIEEDGRQLTCVYSDTNNNQAGCEINRNSNDMWFQGDTIILSANEESILCSGKSESCELTIIIKIDLDQTCYGNECDTIDHSYPKLLEFPIILT